MLYVLLSMHLVFGCALEGRCIFKERELRTAPQIITLRVVMNNPRNNFCRYPYYYLPNEQALPYRENVSVGKPLLSSPEAPILMMPVCLGSRVIEAECCIGHI